MGRSVRIPKEKLLETGLKMIIRDGYSSINITTLAKEAGCSTQPVAWHFGNMENFRKELSEYAVNYVNEKMLCGIEESPRAFYKRGKVYVDMAFDEPKLVSFLQMNASGPCVSQGIGFILNDEKNISVAEDIAKRFDITKESAAGFMQASIVFTHGLSSLISSGALDCTKNEAYERIADFAVVYLSGLGIPKDSARKAFTE